MHVYLPLVTWPYCKMNVLIFPSLSESLFVRLGPERLYVYDLAEMVWNMLVFRPRRAP